MATINYATVAYFTLIGFNWFFCVSIRSMAWQPLKHVNWISFCNIHFIISFFQQNLHEPLESSINSVFSFLISTWTFWFWFSFDIHLSCSCFTKLSGFSCPSITSALVVKLQKLQISHLLHTGNRGAPPPLGQIYSARLEHWAVACGAEPILFMGEMISVSLGSHLL